MTTDQMLTRFARKGPTHIIDNPIQHLAGILSFYEGERLIEQLTYWGYATEASARKVAA